VQDKSPDDIMRLAIANVMIADDAALEQLKLEYDDMMKFSKYYDKFSYITDTSNVDFRDLATTLKIEDTQKIINEYKAKVKNKKLKSEEEKKPLNQVKFEKLKPPEDEKAKEGEAKKPEEAAKKESESIKENKE